jgi:hypothetical protein
MLLLQEWLNGLRELRWGKGGLAVETEKAQSQQNAKKNVPRTHRPCGRSSQAGLCQAHYSRLWALKYRLNPLD